MGARKIAAVTKAFTHEAGKISGTKAIFSLLAAAICVRVLLGAFGYHEIDLAGAAALLGAAGAVYGGRRYTEAWSERIERSSVVNGGRYD